MSITIADIEQIAAHMQEFDIAVVELSGAIRMVLKRDGRPRSDRSSQAHDIQKNAPQSVESQEPGLFLRRHPNKMAAEVNEGDAVKLDQLLGYLRAGNVLQAVRSPAEGILRRILADNVLVGYGTRLVEISPA